MAVGVDLWGEVVLVFAWAMGKALAPASGYVSPSSSIGTSEDNYGSSEWKMTHNMSKASSSPPTPDIFAPLGRGP